MTSHTSIDGTSTSICCYHTNGNPETKCHWNVSIPIVKSIIPERILSQIDNLNALLPSIWAPCASNVTCYSYLHSEDDVSLYLLDNGDTVIKNAVDHLRACIVGEEEFCFTLNELTKSEQRTQSLVDDCKSFFGWLINNNNGTLDLENDTISSSDLWYIIAICISLAFLIATFVVYNILAELKYLSGFILRNYIISCIVLYITFVMGFGKFIWPDSCNPLLAITEHLAVLSTFLWLNVMSFDMWWTFRTMEDSRKQSSRKKKIYYSIFAWGSSILVVAVGLFIDYVPDLPQHRLKPEFEDDCWVQYHFKSILWVQVPMTVSFIPNIFFFASAAITIYRQRNASAQHLEGSNSRRHDAEKYRFNIYLKVFILTGMQWFCQILDLLWHDHWDATGAFIVELPHLLQGLILFIIFVCNDRVKRLLSARLALQYQSIRQWIGLNKLQNSNTSATATSPNS